MTNQQLANVALQASISNETMLEFEAAKSTPAKIKRQEAAKNISNGIVDLLVENAAQAKTEANKPLEFVWDNIIEIMTEMRLSPEVYCGRSGKLIYTINAEMFRHDLEHIIKLTNEREIDLAQMHVIDQIIYAKAHTILPSYLFNSAETLASLRDYDVIGYVLRSLIEAFPMDENADSQTQAIYIDDLATARKHLENTDLAVVNFLAECLHLYLSNIRPASLSQRGKNNTLVYYEDKFISYCVQSPNHIAHLARRIVQLIYNLICKHKIKDFNELSTRDLLSLRVHYQGSPQYKAQKRKLQARKLLEKATKLPALRKQIKMSKADTEMLNLNADFEIELFDLAGAFTTVLEQEVKITPDTPAQEKILRNIVEMVDNSFSEQPLTDIFDGTDFDFNDDDYMSQDIIETPQDALDAGWVTQDEVDNYKPEIQQNDELLAINEDFDLEFGNEDMITPVDIAMEQSSKRKINIATARPPVIEKLPKASKQQPKIKPQKGRKLGALLRRKGT